MDFEKIEDLFPDGAFTIGSGHTCVTAQWLHDFASNISAAEREACAKVCDGYDDTFDNPSDCANAIRARSNA